MNNDLVLMMIKVKLRDMLGAIRHNRRAIDAERRGDGVFDSGRTYLNKNLSGLETPEAVHRQARQLMAAAGYESPRKDAVAYIEAVFSLPNGSGIDPVAYFTQCTDWMAKRFDCPVISSDIHFDEAAPHCHVLILPIQHGRMNGSKMLGYGRAFSAHLDSFYRDVGRHHGMRRTSKLKGFPKAAAAEAVIEALNDQGRLVTDELWPLIQRQIRREPEPWLTMMGVNPTVNPKRMRSFTAIMISPGKGPKIDRANSQG
jgi:hypothetical protein